MNKGVDARVQDQHACQRSRSAQERALQRGFVLLLVDAVLACGFPRHGIRDMAVPLPGHKGERPAAAEKGEQTRGNGDGASREALTARCSKAM